MSRAHRATLAECVNRHNAIDFVHNTALNNSAEVEGNEFLNSAILEGPPAFLEAQGIRYVPAPLSVQAPQETPGVKPLASSMGALQVSEPTVSPEERVRNNIRNCMRIAERGSSLGASYTTDDFPPPRRLARRMDENDFPHPRRLTRRMDEVDSDPIRRSDRLSSMAASRRGEKEASAEMRALHAEIMSASADVKLKSESNSKMRALHAEIMRSTPRTTAKSRPLASRMDSDEEGVCSVVRPSRSALLHR